MPDPSEKRRRKEALARWKADERAAARRKLPLPNDQMRALFDMLADGLPRQGCDRTLRLVRAWLEEQGLPTNPVEEWLVANGGCCDCEALANSEQVWRDAIQDLGTE